MNGADALLSTLVANDVTACFANPGTSEMQFVAALDRKPEMRPVLCLFEGVATGAADGYARVAGKPACTLLHLGPGYGDADWAHGQWKGPGWAESVVVRLDDPELAPRIPFGNIDHVGHAFCDGAEGWGLFEHASIGAHAPTGFTDLMSVAP